MSECLSKRSINIPRYLYILKCFPSPANILVFLNVLIMKPNFVVSEALKEDTGLYNILNYEGAVLYMYEYKLLIYLWYTIRWWIYRATLSIQSDVCICLINNYYALIVCSVLVYHLMLMYLILTKWNTFKHLSWTKIIKLLLAKPMSFQF